MNEETHHSHQEAKDQNTAVFKKALLPVSIGFSGNINHRFSLTIPHTNS